MDPATVIDRHRPRSGSPADLLWARLRDEAEQAARHEPALSALIHGAVLRHDTLEESVVARIAEGLHGPTLPSPSIREAYRESLIAEPPIAAAFQADLVAVVERDPAIRRYLEPLLFHMGFHAVETHRLAHWLWRSGRTEFALCLQSLSSQSFQVDIHPAARLGKGIVLDHAAGLVVGETAEIEDDALISQGVTLGGTGKEIGARHPKIRRGVRISAGASVLGHIEVGPFSHIRAGSVVLESVPPRSTVEGVPAKVVEACGCQEPIPGVGGRVERVRS